MAFLSQGASWTMGWNPTQSPEERESPLGKVQASRLLLHLVPNTSPEASQLAVCWGKGSRSSMPFFVPPSLNCISKYRGNLGTRNLQTISQVSAGALPLFPQA